VSTSASKAHIHIRLAIGLVIAGLIAIIATAVLLIGFLSAAERLEWRSIGSVAELQRAEPILLAIDNHEFYLIWLDVTPSALSTRDPHRGVCKIRWIERERLFADPCGGSMYLPDGSYRRGPSPRNMDQFEVRVVDGQVEINVHRVTLGRKHA
jgi:nitrite reductase/ring-hydroxylating ferredoxin subunit